MRISIGSILSTGAVAASLLFSLAPGAHAGASIVGPVEPHGTAQPLAFEWTISSAADLPQGGAGEAIDPSAHFSVGFTAVSGRSQGVGLTLGYVSTRSSAVESELDRLFTQLSGTPIHGTRFTVNALDLMLRARVVPFPDHARFLRIQGGAGMRRSTGALTLPAEQLTAAGWTVLSTTRQSSNASYEPIAMAGIGLELLHTARFTLGLDATHQWWFVEGSSAVESNRIGGHLTLLQH